MRKLTTLGGIAAAGSLAISLQAGDVGVTSTLFGTQDAQNNDCTLIIAYQFGSPYQCTWTSPSTGAFGIAPDAGGLNGTWIGPAYNGSYYVSGEAGRTETYTPTRTDDKVQLALSGSLTIDPTAGANGSVSGTMVIGAGQWNISTGSATNGYMSWDSITQTLASTAFNSKVANGLGGFDYVLGSKGAPGPLQAEDLSTAPGAFRPSAPDTLNTSGTPWTCGAGGTPNPDGTLTNTACLVGIARSTLMENNVGGTTTGVGVNVVCQSTSAGNADCLTGSIITNGSNANRPLGWDNLILVISTESTGHIVSGQAYWTQEEKIALGSKGQQADKNAYQAGHLTFIPVPAAVWLFGSALGLLGFRRRQS